MNMNRKTRLPRRMILKGAGGAVLAMPFLESLAPRTAAAQTARFASKQRRRTRRPSMTSGFAGYSGATARTRSGERSDSLRRCEL